MIGSIEIARLVALLFIIFIHVSAFGFFGSDVTAGFVIEEFARFGVPLFFIISGFLWKPQTIERPVDSLIRLFSKLAIPMVFWTIVYLVLDKTALLYPGSFNGGIFSYLLIPISGGPGFHLWFLPALFMGTALCWLGLNVTGRRQIFAAAIVLYILGIAIGAYGPLFGLKLQSVFFRNGIFFAPLFLMLGHIIAAEQLRLKMPSALLLAASGFAIHLAEGYAITQRFPHGHDFSFGTVLFGGGMFMVFLALPDAWGRRQRLVQAGRYVFGAYILHIMILYIIASQVADRGIWVAIAAGLSTWVISMAGAWALRSFRLGRMVVL